MKRYLEILNEINKLNLELKNLRAECFHKHFKYIPVYDSYKATNQIGVNVICLDCGSIFYVGKDSSQFHLYKQ